MEGLGVAASVIAVATLADIAYAQLTACCKAAKNCGKEVQDLREETNHLAALLARLGRLAEEYDEEGKE